MFSITFLVLLVAFFAVVSRGRRRWPRWWEYGPHQVPTRGGHPWGPQQVAAPTRADLEAYVDSLESRIAQLEERLDFTERLVTGSKGPVDWNAQPVSRELPASKPSDEPRGEA
jgi:hypothetical protein